MGGWNDGDNEDHIRTGKGEFQLKGISAAAEVEVRNETVCEVRFSFEPHEAENEAIHLAKQLKGHPLAKALSVKAKKIDATGDRASENPIKVALLEAFHRAVEACLDDE
ncbi:MAG: hypothetical protein QNJ97_17410 [Myxococcota bacterium]|nr:hypothetical protein [Myxococcota bacterium]